MRTYLFRRMLVAASALALVATGGLATAPAASAAAPPRPIGRSVTFDHFRVAVLESAPDPASYGYLVKVRVCVRSLPPGSRDGRTRISWDPWTVTVGGRTHRPSVQKDPPPDTFPRPDRSEARFRAGECAVGRLPFRSVGAGAGVTSIDYGNSLGDRARWQPNPLPLGSKATFPHFTVRVSAVEDRQGYIGVRATTCVRSVPDGRRTVRVSWDPWRLRTDGDDVRPAIDHYSPWPDYYRPEVRLAKGQCESGWLVFPLHREAGVTSVGYHNALGDQASWSV